MHEKRGGAPAGLDRTDALNGEARLATPCTALPCVRLTGGAPSPALEVVTYGAAAFNRQLPVGIV